MPTYGIGIDLGGTHITIVIIEVNTGEIIEKIVSTVEDRSVPQIVQLICTSYNKLTELKDNVSGIGIGIPGNVDPYLGITRYLPNFGWTNEVPIAKLLITELNTISFVEMRNDGMVDIHFSPYIRNSDGLCL